MYPISILSESDMHKIQSKAISLEFYSSKDAITIGTIVGGLPGESCNINTHQETTSVHQHYGINEYPIHGLIRIHVTQPTDGMGERIVMGISRSKKQDPFIYVLGSRWEIRIEQHHLPQPATITPNRPHHYGMDI